MPFDYFEIARLRKTHPSWRLMNADNAPLIISFIDQVFREKNARQISEDNLNMLLEDYLYDLRSQLEDDSFPRQAKAYLEEWTTPGKDWLRKFYPANSDIPHYDLTPATEQVLQWIDSFFSSSFIGTESRLKTSIELLRQIINGTEEDAEVRIRELEHKKEAIEKEIDNIRNGHITFFDNRQVRERFIQFRQTAIELLSDFRAVEHHFRELDRDVREQIAVWEGEKGELLDDFFGSNDQISDSDEGQSFKAFWDFLMSPSSQEELSELLDKVYELESLNDLLKESRLKRIHFDWIAAGEQTQRTVARLSAQLRRYLDDRVFWENKRISRILDNIEKTAVLVKDKQPENQFMELEGHRPDINLPMTLPLYIPPEQTELVSLIETGDEEEIDTSQLFNLTYINTARLQENIEYFLDKKNQVRLKEIIENFPLEEGLAELISYINLAEKDPLALIEETEKDKVVWTGKNGEQRQARFPGIIFNRKKNDG